MAMAQVIREFTSAAELEYELEENFLNGGCFIEGAFDVCDGQRCELVLVAPGGGQMEVQCTVVWVVGGDRPGVGLEFVDFDRDLLDCLADFVRAAERHSDPAMTFTPPPSSSADVIEPPSPPPEPAAVVTPDLDLRAASDTSPKQETVVSRAAHRQQDDEARRGHVSAHERLRGLSVAQQIKVAREGDVNERTILERLYGKSVWDALLSNPRLTQPEVARLARMGTLPRPQLETITSNAAWVSSPQVRRALLSNRRLTGMMVEKVLRAMPKHELKLVPKQTAYPSQVRDAARRMIKK